MKSIMTPASEVAWLELKDNPTGLSRRILQTGTQLIRYAREGYTIWSVLPARPISSVTCCRTVV
jgi:hypothetical protein